MPPYVNKNSILQFTLTFGITSWYPHVLFFGMRPAVLYRAVDRHAADATAEHYSASATDYRAGDARTNTSTSYITAATTSAAGYTTAAAAAQWQTRRCT